MPGADECPELMDAQEMAKMEVTTEAIKEFLDTMVSSQNAKIQQASQQDLENYWHFQWDSTATLERNLYHFHEMLDLYGRFCRRWEEAHNGSCCVVERVRDTYLMPKIREFAASIRAAPNNYFMRCTHDLHCSGC